MSKIIALEFLNTMRLKAVNLTPNGKDVILGGRNGAGKSSILNTIAMTFGGSDATPPKPLRRGAEKGHSIIKTDDGLTIRLAVNKDGRGSVTVTTKDNAKYGSPQAVLEKLTGGAVAFDPLEFCNMPADKQRGSLMKQCKLDFTALDAKRKLLYDERTLVNKTVAQQEFTSSTMAHFPDAPTEPVSTADLVADLGRANEHNAEKDRLDEASGVAMAKADEAADATANQRLKIADIEAKLAAARKDLELLETAEKLARTASETAEQTAEAFKPIDTTTISAKLSGAGETNRQIHVNTLRQDALTALDGHRTKAAKLTAEIDAIDKKKADDLAAAPFPVAGLGFDETGVTFNGVPLEQSNFDERLRVSIAMSAALNPTLRVVIIRDASLLDGPNFQHLLDLLKEYDLQGFVERVANGAECSVIIEDGEVSEVRDPEMKVAAPVGAVQALENVLSHDAHEPAPKPTAFSLE